MSSCVESLRTKKVNNLCGYGGRPRLLWLFLSSTPFINTSGELIPCEDSHTLHFTHLNLNSNYDLNLNLKSVENCFSEWIHTSTLDFNSSLYFLTISFQSWATLRILLGVINYHWNLWKVEKSKMVDCRTQYCLTFKCLDSPQFLAVLYCCTSIEIQYYDISVWNQ